MAKRTGGLGQGLDALFYANAGEERGETEVRLTEIEPNRDQPRKTFDETALNELAESIREHGLIQPLLVRQLDSGRYQIVAGERRWRAARLAGLDRVPVIVREMDEKTVMEIALIENLQREDLNAIEEAEGYRALIEKYGMTQEEVARAVTKSRPAVTNALRLLGLEPSEREALAAGKISAGHARALLALSGDTRKEGLRLAMAGATVRAIEELTREPGKSTRRPRQKNKLYHEVELSVAGQTGRRVSVTGNGKTGVLKIEFYSDDDLCDLAKKLAGESK